MNFVLLSIVTISYQTTMFLIVTTFYQTTMSFKSCADHSLDDWDAYIFTTINFKDFTTIVGIC